LLAAVSYRKCHCFTGASSQCLCSSLPKHETRWPTAIWRYQF